MKNFVLDMAVLTFVLFIVSGCGIAGGISRDKVVAELSRHVTIEEAQSIVRNEICIDTNLLLRVATKNLSSETMTILLLHPLFPQWRRNKLIDERRDGFYLGNACLSDRLTDEDVQHWVSRAFVSESMLESALMCTHLSEASKTKIRQRIQRTLSYRMRKLFEIRREKQ